MNGQKKILVIEDDVAMSTAVSKELSTTGYSVTVESDGKGGLIKALSEKPDLIMVDLMLPGMNGLAILESLRKDDWGSKVPVIMLTNFDTDDQTLQKVMNLQPKFYLTKQTVSLTEIVEKVKESLSS